MTVGHDTTPDTTPEGRYGSGLLRHITVELIGEDSNIFNLMGVCARTVRAEGSSEDLEEWGRVQGRVMESKSFDEALAVLMYNLTIV